MPRGRAAALFSFAAIALVVACGVEVVGAEDGPTEGSSSTSSSGGSTSTSSSGTMPVDGSDDVVDATNDVEVGSVDASEAATADASCKPPGKPCTSSSECCNGKQCLRENDMDPLMVCQQ